MKCSEIKKQVLNFSQDVFLNTPVVFGYLYGSIAKEQAHPFSDLDIAVYVPEMAPKDGFELEMALALEFDSMIEQGPSSDVRIMNYLPLTVAGEIVTEGILIYCRDDTLRIDYETSIRSAYFDFLPVLHKFQKEYLEYWE